MLIDYLLYEISYPVGINGRINHYNDIVDRINIFLNSNRRARDYNNLTQLIHTYVPEVGLMNYDRNIMLRYSARVAATATRDQEGLIEIITRYL